MKLKSLFTDDDAVSPVIGVILMVAITVILAAVIGAFVLDLGGNTTSTPTASFEFDDDGSEVTVTHESGDAISESNLRVVAAGESFESGDGDFDTWSTGDEVSAGDSLNISDQTSSSLTTSSALDGEEIRIVWESDDGGTTSTLQSYSVDR